MSTSDKRGEGKQCRETLRTCYDCNGEFCFRSYLAPPSADRAHVHRCMSCGEPWFCPHPPADCKAGESAFPSLTLRGPNGPTVFHHACPGKK